MYELKRTTKGTKKAVNKSLLNNLLGRFGLNIIKPVTKLIKGDRLYYLLSTCNVKSIKEITNDTWLVNYIPIVDPDICLEHGVDYLKAINNYKNSNLALPYKI